MSLLFISDIQNKWSLIAQFADFIVFFVPRLYHVEAET